MIAHDSSDHLQGSAANRTGLQSQEHSLLARVSTPDDLSAAGAEVKLEHTAGLSSGEQEWMNASLGGAAAAQLAKRAHRGNVECVARRAPNLCSALDGQTIGHAKARSDEKRDDENIARVESIGSAFAAVVERTLEVLVVE